MHSVYETELIMKLIKTLSFCRFRNVKRGNIRAEDPRHYNDLCKKLFLFGLYEKEIINYQGRLSRIKPNRQEQASDMSS